MSASRDSTNKIQQSLQIQAQAPDIFEVQFEIAQEMTERDFIQARHAELKRIEEDSKLLAAMFKEVRQQASDQQETIDAIEKKGDETEKQVEKGHQQLKSVERKQNECCPWLQCCTIL